MRKTYWLGVLIFLGLPGISHGFTFFNVDQATVSSMGDNRYRLRVHVDMSIDMHQGEFGFSEGSFTRFSLGKLIGAEQSNFVPLNMQPGVREYYSPEDGFWYTDHLGSIPLPFFSNVFGYDFSHNDIPESFELNYTCVATWMYDDSTSSYLKAANEVYTGTVSTSSDPTPAAIPEPAPLLLLSTGLAGIILTSKKLLG